MKENITQWPGIADLVQPICTPLWKQLALQMVELGTAPKKISSTYILGSLAPLSSSQLLIKLEKCDWERWSVIVLVLHVSVTLVLSSVPLGSSSSDG